MHRHPAGVYSMKTTLKEPRTIWLLIECSPPPTLSIPVSHLTYVSTAEKLLADDQESAPSEV
jgi:hypothetical protein